MKDSRISLVALALSLAVLLCSGFPASAQGERASAIQTIGGPDVALIDGSTLDWREARRIIEAHGGRIEHVVPPSALIGTIPEAAMDALLAPPRTETGALVWYGDAIVIVRGQAAAERLITGDLGSAPARRKLSFEARLGLEFLRPPVRVSPLDDRHYRLNPDGSIEALPPWEWEGPALEPLDQMPGWVRTEGIGNTFYNTSDFMAGDVAIAILRPESNGVTDPNTETWTPAEVTNSFNQLIGATAKLLGNAPNGKLTFVYKTEQTAYGVAGTVESNYEAVAHPNFYSAFVLEVLGRLGYTSATYWDRMHEWVNAVRTSLGTDWAIGIFIVDDSVSSTKVRSSAYLGGPAVTMSGAESDSVYQHELSHSFGANDEYHPDAAQSPTGLSGYTQEVNANSQYNDGTGYFSGAGEGIMALQINNINYPSPWGRGQWGTWDLDGDGVCEPQDTFPTVTLNAPTGTGPLTFTGTASVTPLKKEAGAPASTDISISKITGVEWRLNGGPWQDATASSPPFDASSEAFAFTTPPLRNGGYVIEARATEKFGNRTPIPARRDSTITGSVVTNAAPMVALSVTPALGSTSTSFQFSASGSVDAEDGATLQYRWDWENDTIWDTGYSATATASHGYASAGSKTAAVMVLDTGGATATRTVTFTVAAANVPPTATFTVDKGALFVPGGTPVVFNFDASGVSDGEDAASGLQVRWDFEDDGIWDTSYSTTKTASKNYALGYAINPSNETGNTYIYSGTGLNGYAQSFKAQTGSIGKVDLYLRKNGATDGLLTVGIRSAITGAFLTSISQNRSTIADSTWNTFDFSDIPVTPGNTYYLVILEATNDIVMVLTSTANPYADGQQYHTFSGGSSWSTNTTYDLAFRIYDAALSVVPLTKSRAWAVRMEVLDSNAQTSQTVRNIIANSYDSYPAINASLSCTPCSGTTATSFSFTVTGSDPDSATTWDGLLHYRWDYDGDGNYETEFDSLATRSGVTYPRSRIYPMTVEARDRYHATFRSSWTVNVAPGLTALVLADRTDGSTTTTDELIVEARLTASALPEEAILSESATFAGATWEPYRPVLAFALSAGSGLKTVYAKTRSGVGNESGVVSATITSNVSGCTPPGAPTLTAATGTCSGVNLAWTAGTGTTLSYNVYRFAGSCGGGYSKIAGPVAGLTYSDTSGVAGTSYAYVVRGACDAGGAGESGNSNCLTATRLAIPAAPAAPTFSGLTCNSLTVNWAAVPSATTYDVYRSTGGTCATPAKLTGSPITGTTYPDSGLAPGGQYSYFIVANSTCGTSANGACAPVTVGGPPTFGAISSVTNPGSATCTLDLAWTAGTSNCGGTITYNIYRNQGSAPVPPSGLLVTGVSGTTYSDTNALSSGLPYYYIVRAKDSANGLEDSNVFALGGIPTGPIGAPTTIFTEDFDGATAPAIPSGWLSWTVSGSAAWSTSAGTVYPPGGGTHSGTNVARFNSYDAPAGNQALLYRTSGVNLTTSVAASVSFWMYHDPEYSASNDTVQVHTSTDSGANWVARGTAIGRYAAVAGWTQHTVSITPAAGFADVRIAFLGTSAYGNDCYIDDATISSTAMGTCTTGGGSPPPEIGPGTTPATSQGWTNKTTTTWPADAAATSYSLYRGVKADLPQLLNATVDSCTKYTGAATSTGTITENPTAGSFYWYLVTGSNGNGEGSAGSASAGPRVVNTSGVCP